MKNTLEDFKHYLSRNEEVIHYDIKCFKPVLWGYTIIKDIPKEVLEDLKNVKGIELVFINTYPEQCLVVTKTLSRKEAIEKYGKVNSEEYNDAGTWQSVTFGTTKFVHPALKK